jgi:putative ABC transport system permease protein
MMLWDSFWIALGSLRGNKMRSFLTMLGIIIGVGSVITMVAIGAGAQTQVAEQIRSLGANLLMSNQEPCVTAAFARKAARPTRLP